MGSITTDEVNVKFGATIDDFKSKMGEMTGILKGVVERFAAISAVAAGGAVLKHFIDEANTLNAEATKLSKTLGITAEEAGTLNTALGDIGADADTYSGAFLKFNRALRTNSEGMKELGVDIDAFKRGQKSSNDLFQESIKIVGQYKPGIDQTQVAMQLFGRSVADVQQLLKLTAEKLEEAKKKNQELNLVITEEGVAASKKYKEAMNDVHDVLRGLEKTIGEAVIPIFTKLSEMLASIGPTLVEGTKAAMELFVGAWDALSGAAVAVWSVISQVVSAIGGSIDAVFGKDAPGAMEIFKTVLRTVEAMFIGFRISFELAAAGIKLGLALLSNAFTTFAEVADRALHFDWAGVKNAWRAGADEANRILQEGMDKAVRIAERGQRDINMAVATDAERKALAEENYGHEGRARPQKELKRADFGNKKGGADDAAMAAELALRKAIDEAALAQEREYLKEAQALYDDQYAAGLMSLSEYWDRKLAIELKGIDATLNAKRQEAADAEAAEVKARAASAAAKTPQEKNKFDAQATKFLTEQVKLLSDIGVLEQQRAEAARKAGVEYTKAEETVNAELAAIRTAAQKAAVDSAIESDRKVLEQKKAMGEIAAEDAFAIERSLEERTYKATLDALAARTIAIKGSLEEQSKAKAQVQADTEAAERDHQARLTAIANAAELERKKYSLQAQDSVKGSFQTLVAGMLNGVTKMSDLLRNFAQSVANTFVNLIAQKFTDRLFEVTGVKKAIDKMVSFLVDGIGTMVGKWFGFEAEKTGATAEGTAERGAIEEAGALKSIAIWAMTAIKNIAAAAWQAAAAVYAAVAAIPPIGFILAPAMAIAAGAAVLGFAARIASSEGGEYQVDRDRLNFVHKDETILPAPFATGLRKLVGEGGLSPLAQAANQISQVLTPRGVGPALSSALPTVGAPASGWWQVPASPLAGIQAAASGATIAAQQPADRQRAEAPIHIHGTPDDTVKLRDLASLLTKMHRDNRFKR